MAVKKTQLYASLWASCDKLRGGMDSSEYKDYILTLLFMKYVTDKFKNKGAYEDIKVFDKAHDKDPDPEKRTGCSFDDFIALKGKKNIGEGMDKIIARLADENTDLKGVIDIAHFNDEKKLGSGKEMVDKLTDLISIFQRPELDFSRNKAEGDDIIGDAYEYLMRKFATESGKSKGQFYTPAEVSRILANVVGISRCTNTSATVCDPACGSGSLLIRAIDAAPIPIMGYGQEKESTTAGLAKMNAVLHRKAEITIKSGNTFSNPQYLDKSDNSILERFDYIVANPPFSMKNWRDGIAGKEYGRFEGYGDMPPEKNGDYAWLMHILKALKSNGKAAVILPHGVLFRGNAEATIREAIIKKHWIKGIISLPANLFYGTGIAACVLVIDKEGAANRQGIFMIDASRGYVKDGNKNRLRERDIYRIITTFNEQITTDPKYARFVPNDEIEKKNGYNLNITRYIDSTDPEDIQDIYAHIHGGIPAVDIDGLSKYWEVFPSLKSELLTAIIITKLAMSEEENIALHFNTNPDAFTKSVEIGDGIYVWTNTSTQSKLSVLSRLFKLYNEDPSDLVFYLRDENEANEDEPGSRYELRRKYWTCALPIIQKAHGEDGSFSNVNPSRDNWLNGSFGIGGFYLCCVANYDAARAEVVFGRGNKQENKDAFDSLYTHKAEIESALGTTLQWNRGDDIKSSKVFIQLNNVSIENETDWLQMANFHADWTKKFYDVIVPFIKG